MKHAAKALLTALALVAAGPATAATDRPMTVKASVDGMVCSFCTQGIVAHFRKHKAVSDIHVDLDRKLVILAERKGASISDDEIRDAVKRAGFTTGGIKRITTSFEDAKKAKS
jgi:copper chaperone CopZ